jgi:hypothetical protein
MMDKIASELRSWQQQYQDREMLLLWNLDSP